MTHDRKKLFSRIEWHVRHAVVSALCLTDHRQLTQKDWDEIRLVINATARDILFHMYGDRSNATQKEIVQTVQSGKRPTR